MALVVAVPAGLGFTLPTGTPSNAIAYSSGYLTVRDMMIPGAILAVSSWITFAWSRTSCGRFWASRCSSP